MLCCPCVPFLCSAFNRVDRLSAKVQATQDRPEQGTVLLLWPVLWGWVSAGQHLIEPVTRSRCCRCVCPCGILLPALCLGLASLLVVLEAELSGCPSLGSPPRPEKQVPHAHLSWAESVSLHCEQCSCVPVRRSKTISVRKSNTSLRKACRLRVGLGPAGSSLPTGWAVRSHGWPR